MQSRQSPNVLYVLDSFDATPHMTQSVIEQCLHVQDQGGHCIVAGALGENVNKLRRLRIPNVSLSSNGASLWRSGKLRRTLGQVVSGHNISLIDHVGTAYAMQTCEIAHSAGIPHILTLDRLSGRSFPRSSRLEYLFSQSNKIVVTSTMVAKGASMLIKSAFPMTTIPRGITVETFDEKQISASRLGEFYTQIVGDNSEHRPAILVESDLSTCAETFCIAESLGILRELNPSLEFLALFSGRLEAKTINRLRKMIRTLDLEGFVRLVGRLSDRHAAYKGVDIVFDGMAPGTTSTPWATLEAQSSARRVIAFHDSSAAQVVRHKHNGWVTRSGDPLQLAQYINEAFQISSGSRKTMEQNAQQMMYKQFTSKLMTERTLNLYRTAMGR